jgi:4-hydroxybenzoate polyprenyltransferase
MIALKPYIQIARPDHWIKNVFTVPGVVLALYADPDLAVIGIIPQLALALMATCLAASSNYVINEILDAPSDRHHPVKRTRPVASGAILLRVGYVEWLLLGLVSIGVATLVGAAFVWSIVGLLVMGLLYNVPPFRLKDVAYVDVLSESVNNPIRLVLGWYATGTGDMIMASALLAYWMLGAFLMAVKRYAEYRHIDSPEVAVQYRKSFAYYNSFRLLVSIIYYATAFGLFAGFFLARYRLELILSVPLMAGFMAYYLHLGFRDNSPVQYPEGLYRYTGFVAYSALCLVTVLGLMFVEIPAVHVLFAPGAP